MVQELMLFIGGGGIINMAIYSTCIFTFSIVTRNVTNFPHHFRWHTGPPFVSAVTFQWVSMSKRFEMRLKHSHTITNKPHLILRYYMYLVWYPQTMQAKMVRLENRWSCSTEWNTNTKSLSTVTNSWTLLMSEIDPLRLCQSIHVYTCTLLKGKDQYFSWNF